MTTFFGQPVLYCLLYESFYLFKPVKPDIRNNRLKKKMYFLSLHMCFMLSLIIILQAFIAHAVGFSKKMQIVLEEEKICNLVLLLIFMFPQNKMKF